MYTHSRSLLLMTFISDVVEAQVPKLDKHICVDRDR